LPVGDPFNLNFKSTGFLFEHESTGATARRADCPPANDFFRIADKFQAKSFVDHSVK
jgi:hypothetical protein